MVSHRFIRFLAAFGLTRRLAALGAATVLTASMLPFLAGSALAATPVTVCAVGCDYTTIQAAVNDPARVDGDTIDVKAGTYAVVGANITKSLTLLGANAGVDARGSRGAETVITSGGLGTFALNATDVTFDGFTFSNLTGRTIDTYFDADNFTMRNNILQAASIDPGYNTGAIQFGGGLSLHANGLTFEQNLVTADNGQLFYMGHAMDNGTIRNNLFNGDSVSFGPFGNRTGWVIEGNEFDGDVPGHSPYWGFGFNANLGDVVIRDNYVHEMLVGIGQISVVGGTIEGNTFDDNSFAAFQLWGGEYGSVVSDNVSIAHNLIKYNGTSCTGFADASHGIRLRPAGDATTIHLHQNAFIDLAVGACAEAWALRNNSNGSADATLNYWDTLGPQAVIDAKIGQGTADVAPWISAYSDDPAHSGDLGFWPLVTTATTVTSDVPDPSSVNTAYAVGGTVEVTGLGGVTSNFAVLPGEVAVTDGTDGCTDGSLVDSGTLNEYSFSCNVTSTTTGAKTLSASYTDTSAEPFYDMSSGTAGHTVQLPAQAYKTQALAELQAIGTTGIKDTDKRIADAIKDIQSSLDRPNWIDANHIDGKNADKVFEDEKHAVKALMGVKDPVPAGVTNAINDLLEADRLLAQTAIDDAAGGDPKKLAEAEKEMDKATDEIAKGHYDNAIDHYKNAWKKAQEA